MLGTQREGRVVTRGLSRTADSNDESRLSALLTGTHCEAARPRQHIHRPRNLWILGGDKDSVCSDATVSRSHDIGAQLQLHKLTVVIHKWRRTVKTWIICHEVFKAL